MKTHKFVVRMSESNFCELRKIADKELKSINSYINKIIEYHISNARKSDITGKHGSESSNIKIK